MIGFPRSRLSSHRPSQLRAVRTYLLAILILTLLFFSVSLISLVRQQETVRELSSSNLRSDGERITLELERRAAVLAQKCLESEQLKSVPYTPGKELSPEAARVLRGALDGIRTEHPIARYFLILENDRVVFPRVAPPQDTVKAMISANPTRAARQFESLMQDAYNEESAPGGDPRNALRVYTQASKLDVPDRLKALAAFRAAKMDQRENGTVASLPAFRELLRLYGDQYDETQTPYKLVLALDRMELANRIYTSYPDTLQTLRQSLIKGQWELSAAQADRYLSLMDHRLGLESASRSPSEFLDQFAMAQAASQEFQAKGAIPGTRVNNRKLRLGARVFQTYYTLLSRAAGHNVIVGLSVSAPWLQQSELPGCIKDVAGNTIVSGSIEEASEEQNGDAEATALHIPFGTTLSPWQLSIPSGTILKSEAEAHREIWFLGSSAGMFLCILGLGIYLLVRVTRDMQWFRLRTDFVSGVSHELKTPLSLIRLYSETLSDDEQTYPPEERKSYIRIIARESERLSRLIDNILDFSKIEQGRKRYELRDGDIAATVKQTVEDYSEYLALRGFTVKTGIQASLPPVRFSPEQVSQMVLNLMDNARKYSDKSRLIRVHMWRQDDDVVLEVQDYGFGIPPEEQEKIFEPFYRVPKGSEKGGCGLGLYLVRNVIDGHGGRIEVLSEVGKGSRFRLYFPVLESARKSNLREASECVQEDSLIETR